MNKYQKELLQKIKEKRILGFDDIITSELKKADWLTGRELYLTNNEMDDDDFTLEVSSSMKEARNMHPHLIDLSQRITNVLDSLEDLRASRYIVESKPVRIDVPVGQSLFSLGVKGDNQYGKVIFPDQELTNRLTTFLSSTFALTENGQEYIANGFKTKQEIDYDNSFKTTNGILNANKWGLGLTTAILLLSGISLYNSQRASNLMDKNLVGINSSVTDLKNNLDSLNTSLSGISEMVSIFDTTMSQTIEKTESGYLNLEETTKSLGQSIRTVSESTSELKKSISTFSNTIKKIDSEYSRVPKITITSGKCSRDSIGPFISDFILINKGDISTKLQAIEIQMVKDDFFFEPSTDELFEIKSDKNNIVYRLNFYKRYLDVLPSTPWKIAGKLRPVAGKTIEGEIDFFIPYESKYQDGMITVTTRLNCE